ncbi:MAG: hypothetical protein IPJ24_03980 [bacterium]|nr:hypothetical protein [bacterium]
MNIRRLTTIGALVLSSLAANPCPANDTVMNQGAGGLEPLDVRSGRESPIRLVDEELTFRFGKWRTSVKARFVFENTRTDSTVRQLSGFPDVHDNVEGSWAGAKYEPRDVAEFDTRYRVSELRDMKTRIDGRRVSSQVRYGYIDEIPESESKFDGAWVPVDSISGVRVRWYVVELVIPPRGRVTLERSYNVRNGVLWPEGGHFQYHLSTGGAWHGTIGRMRATLILEDGLTSSHMVVPWPDEPAAPDSLSLYHNEREWRYIASDRLTLEWTDFDPWREPRKRSLNFQWEPLPGEEYEPYEVLHRKEPGSRWWPGNWFR